MFTSILEQIDFPEGYTSTMLWQQVALHMLRNADVFFPLINLDLEGESYHSYLLNIYEGAIRGDDIIVAAIGWMFNISITILTPVLAEPMHLFHDEIDNPQVIIVGNGGPAGYEIQNTHFSSTVSRRPNVKLPGSTLSNEQRKIHKLYRYGFGKNWPKVIW